MKHILIAGIGNIFLGDDAFGVETVRQLAQRPLSEGVRVVDFGIRAYDLAYALTDSYDAAILVDAVPRGEPPGTVYLIKPEVSADSAEQAAVDAHSLNPVVVLQMARSLGNCVERLYLVGCEPAVLEDENGELGLSVPVQAAVLQAVAMIESLVQELLSEQVNSEPRPESGWMKGNKTVSHPSHSGAGFFGKKALAFARSRATRHGHEKENQATKANED